MRSTILLIWGFCLALLAALATGAYLIHREQTVGGLNSALSYARLSAEHVGNALHAADLTTLDAADHLPQIDKLPESLADPIHRETLIRKEITSVLSAHAARLANYPEAVIGDANGRLIASSSEADPTESMAGRSFFNDLKQGTRGAIAISAAFRRTTSGPMVMLLARRLEQENGEFSGFVGVALDINKQFASFQGGLGLPPDAHVAIFSEDGRLLTRFPQLEEYLGKPPPSPRVVELLSNHQTESVALGKSVFDDNMRAYAVRDVPGYPVRVLVSLSEDQYMAYSRSFNNYAISGGIVAILLGGLLSFLAIRKQQADTLLSQERQRRIDDLNEITTAVPGIIFSFRRTSDGTMSLPYVSSRVEALYGTRVAVLKNTVTPMLDRIHPEDLPRFIESIEHSARHLLAWNGKWRYRNTADEWRWMEGHSQPAREPDGSILWHGYAADVTERQNAADLETEVSGLVKAAQDSLMAHVAVLDREGVIISVNDGWRRFAEENQREAGITDPRTGIGTNYLQICAIATGDCSGEASLVNAGIKAVLGVLSRNPRNFRQPINVT